MAPLKTLDAKVVDFEKGIPPCRCEALPEASAVGEDGPRRLHHAIGNADNGGSAALPVEDYEQLHHIHP